MNNHQTQEESVSAFKTHHELDKDTNDEYLGFIQPVTISKKLNPVRLHASLDQFVSWK